MDLRFVRNALAKLERLSRGEREKIEGFAELKPYLYKLAYVAETRRKLTKRNKAKMKRLYRELERLRATQNPAKTRKKTARPKQVPNASRQKCYMCRMPHACFRTDKDAKMCPSCVKLNATMRAHTPNVKGQYILITGGRIKVGYHTALAFLRAGAHVMVTTRFPKDALERYRKESDTDTWFTHLRIVAADFTRIHDIQRVIVAARAWTTTLDVLINNAAQTIRRPRAFYHPLLEKEKQLYLTDVPTSHERAIVVKMADTTLGIPMVLDHAYDHDTTMFPEGQVDVDGQQLDLRLENTWTQGIRDTDTVECVETMLINSIGPFHLIKAILPLLKHEGNRYGWILNITSAEGRFDKGSGKAKHPHNNMSKAALNMLTRTIANDVKRDRAIITAIDIGWVNNMGPRDQLGNGMALLSYADAVARIMHPLGERDPLAFNGKLVRHFVIREVW